MAGQEEVRAEIISMSVKSIKEDKVEVDVELEVENRNSVALQLVDIEFMVDEDEDRHIVQHLSSIQPRTSEIIRVPLNLACIKPAAAASSSGTSGRVIPLTIRARMNFWESLRGMFQISVGRLKQFLTIIDHKLGIGMVRTFVPPTGFVTGANLTDISSEEATINFEARLTNGNPVPIQFLYADISVESNGIAVIPPTRIEQNMTLGGRTSRKVTLPVPFRFKQLLLENATMFSEGGVIPYTAKLDYSFKENSHGMYKVSGEKVGELPIPIKPSVKIQAASFSRDDDRRAVAKVCLKMSNRNEFAIRVTKLHCEISDGTTGAVSVAFIPQSDTALDVDAGAETSVWMVASSWAGNEASFGSALWDVFTDDYSRFHVVSVVEVETTKFGKMVFQ